MRRVLVVIDDDSARQALQLRLRSDGYEPLGVSSVEDARRALEADPFTAVLARSGLLMSVPAPTAPAGLKLASLVAAGRGGLSPGLILGSPILIAILPSGATPADGLAAMNAGAHDFVVEAGDLPALATLALRKAELRAGQGRSTGASTFVGGGPTAGGPGAGGDRGSRPDGLAPLSMVGKSPPMVALAAAVRKVAPFKATVFVNGESGTGKELIARAVHQQSPRADGPFVAVNCGAIPAGLMESELLGHAKGAFTDAHRDRAGLLEQASGGTLFLDEIAELPLALQVKLLRVLQDDSVRRLGDAEERPVDVRLVAATARDLEAEVAAGRFREDLYHRINVVALRVPPLRQRGDDIPLLVAHFVARVNQRLGLGLRSVSGEAMRALVSFAWPGNVRELENTVERAAVMCEGDEIDLASLPERILGAGVRPSTERVTEHTPPTAGSGARPPRSDGGPGSTSSPDGGEMDLSIKRAARRAEEDLIRRALARTGGNRTRAAELLEISHRALLYKIKEYGVSLPMTSPGHGKDAKL